MFNSMNAIREDLSSLTDYDRKLKQFSDQGCLLAIEQIADSFKHKIFSDSIMHCVALKKTYLSPSLSVSWIDNDVVYSSFNVFKSLDDCFNIGLYTLEGNQKEIKKSPNKLFDKNTRICIM